MIKRPLLLTVLLLLTACSSGHEKDMKAMNPFAQAMKTACVGRVLIDMPAGRGSWTQNFDSAKVEKLDITNKHDFDLVVSKRIEELKSSPHQTESSLLSKVIKNGEKGTLILFRDNEIIDSAFSMERYLWPSGFMLSRNVSNEDANQIYNYTPVFEAITVQQNDEIPHESGFCVENALITNLLIEEYGTRADYGVVPRGWAGAGVEIGIGVTENQNTPPDSAIDQLSEDEAAAKEAAGSEPEALNSFKVLRKRERMLGSFAGEETVTRREYNNGAVLYEFFWLSPGRAKSIVAPAISISMTTGHSASDGSPASKVIPEEELFGLWDAVLPTLHWRQGALPQGAR